MGVWAQWRLALWRESLGRFSATVIPRMSPADKSQGGGGGGKGWEDGVGHLFILLDMNSLSCSLQLKD